MDGVIEGSTWSPANSRLAAASMNTTWPLVWPGVGTESSVRAPSSTAVPGSSQVSGDSQTPASMSVRGSRAASSSAPQRCSRSTLRARLTSPGARIACSESCSPTPSATSAPDSARTLTAWV